MRKNVPLSILRHVAFVLVTSVATQDSFADSDAYTNGVSSYIVRAAAFAATGNWDKMIAECSEAIRLNPNAIDAYRGRGAAYYQKGDWNNVISNYSEVIRLKPNDPDDSDAYSYLGYAYDKLGDYDKAIESYNKYLDLNPRASAEHYSRGTIYGKKREADKAISDYDAAIKLDPKNADAYFMRGFENGYKGDFDKTIDDLSEAIRLKPKNPQAYLYRADAYRHKGDLEKAVDDYSKSSNLDPNNTFVWSSLNHVAWQLATSPENSIRNGKKSLEAAKTVCELSAWGDWRFLDTLAAAYAETGDFDNATKFQKMALAWKAQRKFNSDFGLVERLQLYEQKKPYREVLKE